MQTQNQREVTPELLRQIMRYEPDTGLLFWRERPVEMFNEGKRGAAWAARLWNAKHAGKRAFTYQMPFGYFAGRVFGKGCTAHRAAWALHHGEWPNVIDHINGDPTDNRIENLRSVDQALNMRNIGATKVGASGARGVEFRKGRWRARIRINNRHKFLGSFDTKNAAVAARLRAERELGFHENHGRRLG